MERMKRLIAIGCAALAASTCAFGRDTAIYNGKLTSDLNANGNAVTSLKEPSADSDAATKKYVDEGVANATPKDYDSVKARVVTNEMTIATVATSATNLVASATNEISKAVTKAQSTADGAVAKAASAQSTADAAKSAAAANETAIATHAGDTANPHKVTAAQVGALTDSAAEAKYAQKTDVQWTNEYSRIGLYKGEYNCPMILAPGASSGVMFALGYKSTTAQISHLFPDGSDVMTYTRVSNLLKDYVSSSKLTSTLKSYATANALADVKASIPVISATDATFSNAVLAVGLNIDTNSVAVLNEIAKDFGGFPLSAGETATTVGGLLAALTAGLAALKKSVSTLSSKVDDANAALEEVA